MKKIIPAPTVDPVLISEVSVPTLQSQSVLSLLQDVRSALSDPDCWSDLWDEADDANNPKIGWVWKSDPQPITRHNLNWTIDSLWMDSRGPDDPHDLPFDQIHADVWRAVDDSALTLFGDVVRERIRHDGVWSQCGWSQALAAIGTHGHSGLLDILDFAIMAES